MQVHWKQWLRDRTDAAIAKEFNFVSECAGMEATGDGPVNEAEWSISRLDGAFKNKLDSMVGFR